MNNLSDRLKTIANLVIEGESVADIGTDHGYVPIALLSNNKVPFAVLSDVNDGPIKIAKENLEKEGINQALYSLREGNGLETLENGEVSSVIIAGMGGELIESILDSDPEKSHSFKRFILQPRTRSNELRYYLSNNSYEFVDYKLVKEKFRICEIFVVKPSEAGKVQSDCSLISKFLLKHGDPLLLEFIDHKIESTATVLKSLDNSDTEDGDSQKEIFRAILNELVDIRKGLNE